MKIIYVLLIFCSSIQLYSQNVKIAAAADLRYAMEEIVKVYKQSNPKANIEIIYGSSGNAYTQIVNGAPYDMYFSADIMYPQKLQEAGITISAPKLYAIGQLVIWSATKDISKGILALNAYSNAKIAIANPEHAPYGKRAVESFNYFKVYTKVKPQLLYGENIAQAAQFCLSGNADIGILALSLVLSPSMAGKGKYVIIDQKSHLPLQQGFVILKQAKNNKTAFAFAKFFQSKQARTILGKYGFTVPK